MELSIGHGSDSNQLFSHGSDRKPSHQPWFLHGPLWLAMVLLETNSLTMVFNRKSTQSTVFLHGALPWHYLSEEVHFFGNEMKPLIRHCSIRNPIDQGPKWLYERDPFRGHLTCRIISSRDTAASGFSVSELIHSFTKLMPSLYRLCKPLLCLSST